MLYRRQSGPHARPGFNFTLHMRRLCNDIVARLPQLAYIELDRVALGFSQTRKPGPYGLYASLTPLRFDAGRKQTVRRGRRWEMQRLVDDAGREMLYILNFYLPRFLDLNFRDKITTVIHELWHISPNFNGDLRRHDGRCYAHGRSGRHDAQSEKLADLWLSQNPPRSVYDFLHLSFAELRRRRGPIFGRKIPAPKLFIVE